jgi:hypothetical protein
MTDPNRRPTRLAAGAVFRQRSRALMPSPRGVGKLAQNFALANRLACWSGAKAKVQAERRDYDDVDRDEVHEHACSVLADKAARSEHRQSGARGDSDGLDLRESEEEEAFNEAHPDDSALGALLAVYEVRLTPRSTANAIACPRLGVLSCVDSREHQGPMRTQRYGGFSDLGKLSSLPYSASSAHARPDPSGTSDAVHSGPPVTS